MSRSLINSFSRPLAPRQYDELVCKFTSLSTSHHTSNHQSQSPSYSSRCNHKRLQQQQQIRYASTARRHRKLLNLPPSLTHGGPSHPTGSSGRSRTALQHSQKVEGDHVLFDPAPTPPNPYHTPLKFLPKGDIRRVLHEQEITSSASPNWNMNANATWPASAELPPPVKLAKRKNHSQLGPEQIEEMRALKLQDENYWTQWRLAHKFNCSNVFVSMMTRASNERRARLQRDEIERRKRWSARRKRAFEDKQKRRAMIERDE